MSLQRGVILILILTATPKWFDDSSSKGKDERRRLQCRLLLNMLGFLDRLLNIGVANMTTALGNNTGAY